MSMNGFEELMAALKESNRPYDFDMITQAYEYADKAHEGQMRQSGEPYITHPIAVARILVELGMDTETICAGLLHDVVEDTASTLDEIKKMFGADVALMVDGVTKLTKLSYSSKEQRQAENVRKMLLAMAKDVRVIIVKLADRLHNMRTGEYWKEYKRREKALETMEVYAPLADRLGIRSIKEELEDISLRFLDPIAYEEIERMLKLKKEERERFLDAIQEKIRERLNKEGMKFFLQSRVKSIYGIYRKVYMQGRNFDEIYDVYAVRVIVDTSYECYSVLGIMHDEFTPIPKRFKDYISTPKANMYQSLHTTVLDKEGGIPFEIQIRTWEMHYTAEYGIAAHWKYKAGIEKKDKLEERLAWVRQLLEVQQDSGDAQDIVRSIKSDIAPEECFVFTPKGDVINLPTGSTVIDFAYAIHSEVGNRMTGAKVDGRIVPLDFKLETGMIVEIITSKGPGNGPSRDWLKIVKTSEARTKIRAWFKKERREENIITGKEELEREFKRNLINVPENELEDFVLNLAKRQHINTLEDFYAAIGYGGVLLSRLMPRVKEEFQKTYRSAAEEEKKAALLPQQTAAAGKKPGKPTSGVIVEGLDSCLVKFAKCCNPLPGDPIVGFITRGYGVSIHKQDCVNVLNSPAENEGRWVRAEWASNVTSEKFKSTIDITSQPRDTLLADVTILLSNMHIPMHALVAKESKDHSVILIQVTVEVNGVDQLSYLLNSLRAIKGVEDVRRTIQ
ncbi:MAG: bifunctional (p)ppGpp synthetase/guanosine-3',5'-bis(diphosphate) 3'-pyrophosphohydrolase [Negativibacillus sp.]|nr:bifunctional (p)ppGpp synthetase/guanosine-3',5'-bis(diphosphate) 3'-pyrophosphohydrolase [Clostridium sp.]MEE0782705.1 bifunctional (p)ppGpp synthetase/guanosine-3',5'-bis(diphosphate) 3'-pyrophosphohydrolase [Negativibacillus sp.]